MAADKSPDVASCFLATVMKRAPRYLVVRNPWNVIPLLRGEILSVQPIKRVNKCQEFPRRRSVSLLSDFSQ